MKKILSCFLVCAFLCTGLYGCGSKKTELIEEAKDLTLSQEISITPEQNDYGIPAYNFLKHIQSNGCIYFVRPLKWWICGKRHSYRVF